jgi:putative ABC transport system permease protein
MLLWVHDELNYDRFHERAEHLSRVERDYGDARSIYATPSPLGPAFEAQLPEVARAARFTRYGSGLTLRFGDRLFYETGYAAADPALFDLFSFPFTRGSAEAALATPSTMVLTETLAE